MYPRHSIRPLNNYCILLCHLLSYDPFDFFPNGFLTLDIYKFTYNKMYFYILLKYVIINIIYMETQKTHIITNYNPLGLTNFTVPMTNIL